MVDEKPFLKRWSKQKLADAEPDVEIAEENAVVPVEEGPPVEIDPADLPDIETLNADSDFTAFLQAGVPEKLKRIALQKLWRSSPELAVLDGLNDYDEDFNLIGDIARAVTSAYTPGKGYADDDAEEESDTPETLAEDGEKAPATESADTEEKGDSIEDAPDDELNPENSAAAAKD